MVALARRLASNAHPMPLVSMMSMWSEHEAYSLTVGVLVFHALFSGML